jgi:site-specific DNA-methyltransferase (adenine-specific)
MTMAPIITNTLFYGDNLDILREYIADESIDLIYLDPPFNSNRSYNVLFKDESGKESEAQITAFKDTWHWSQAAERAYHELVTEAPARIATMIGALRQFIGTNQMMAYLVMMAARLVELHRVLKPTGSLYLHCDPTASHYLKVILDTIFDPRNFRSEIIWKRSAAHGGPVSFNDIHDVILYFSKGRSPTWNPARVSHDESYIKSHYSNIDLDGRRYQLVSAHGAGSGPPRRFGDRVLAPPPGRHWMSQEHIDKMMAEGKVVFTKSGMPRYKRYLDETEGTPLGTVWDDIPPVNSQAAERLGYPTQKPLALLERIMQVSSNPGDLVLDPFCGCGTTIAAAQNLGRRWIGIDITHLSIALMKYRLCAMFPDAQFKVIGEPEDVGAARQLAHDDRYQFQWWALSLVRARPLGDGSDSKRGKKGSDKGIDGVINFIDDPSGKPKRVLVQVKSGHVKSGDIRDLRGTVEREGAAIGVFITLEPPSKDMETEAVSAGFYHSPGWGRNYPKIQILTIAELLHGAEVQMPPAHGTFKQAQRVWQPDGEQQGLDF